MPWADAGTVFEQRCVGGRLHRLRLAWVAGSAGTQVAVLNLAPLFGVLHRLESEETDGTITYDVYLHDEFDADVLNGQGAGLTIDTTTTVTLRVLLDGSDLPRPIAVGGRHVFRTSGGAGRGVFNLWYWPTMDRRLEHRLIF